MLARLLNWSNYFNLFVQPRRLALALQPHESPPLELGRLAGNGGVGTGLGEVMEYV